MSKDEWIQKAKALLFDCQFCVDSPPLIKEINNLINIGGGYDSRIESSKTTLNWIEDQND